MTVRELREKFVRFFESKGHRRFPAGSLIPIDVTGRLDESLLFNGAGMIQFKPYFRGVARPEHPRLVNCQPCVRTSDIEEVGDDTHCSFFEMLGNFSFGDYFKRKAIAFSWEFMTSPQWLGLDPSRLSVTIFEQDDEAYEEWAGWMLKAGIDPQSRIVRLGEETNYWPAGAFSNGPPGPCGPNSEMFYWVSDEAAPNLPYTRDDWIRDEAAGKWVEFWNDVFIQFDWAGRPSESGKGYVKEGMPELPFRSIDTGMGLERSALVLGGYASVYDTDVFVPIFAKIRALGGDAASALAPGASPAVVRANRIVADHLRTSAFCIAEGILPGNTGRGYVLRRLIRRATLQGQRALDFHEPFLSRVFEGVLAALGEAYPLLADRREAIEESLLTEELLFRRTLTHGLRLLEEQMAGVSPGEPFSGAAAFHLYDTFGFPLEITQEILTERGYGLDLEGYEAALAEAQLRSRGAQERESVYGGVTAEEELAVSDAPGATEFLGYQSTESTARIARVRPEENVRVALDRTPFYAESGGQTGDTGVLELPNGTRLTVLNTTKSGGTFWHELASPAPEPRALVGARVHARVDTPRRDRIRRNHTATHLLQASLRRVLGPHVGQAGSYVGPDNLRFDFAHSKAMTREEVEEVERLVNREALANVDVVTHVDLPIAEARARGAMALFGEKYGEFVRMVEVDDFSRELCGGIHVRTTGQIGLFKIVSESSAASGVRRIEAITGEAAYEWVRDEVRRIGEAAVLLKTSPRNLVPAVERVLETAREERRKRERAEMAAMQSGGAASEANEVLEIGPVVLWRRAFGEVDPKLAATAVDNAAAGRPNQITLAAVVAGGKPQFICKVGAEAIAAGAHAGNIVREVAKIAEGGGGGRPDFATAGGKNAAKVGEALGAAEDIVRRCMNR